MVQLKVFTQLAFPHPTHLLYLTEVKSKLKYLWLSVQTGTLIQNKCNEYSV